MKQWFQLRALRSDCVGFEKNGGGVFIGKVEPLGSFLGFRATILSVHLSQCCEVAPHLLEEARAIWPFET
uniref:Uncharacterized protein n=1 Tax=Helianthus annuus TaxID=4232 RepID=A0A251V6E8_HELAN